MLLILPLVVNMVNTIIQLTTHLSSTSTSIRPSGSFSSLSGINLILQDKTIRLLTVQGTTICVAGITTIVV